MRLNSYSFAGRYKSSSFNYEFVFFPLSTYAESLQNGRSLHPPSLNSIRSSFSLHPCPLDRSRVYPPNSCGYPLDPRPIRTLLRPFRFSNLPLLHSSQSLSTNYTRPICCCSRRKHQACLAKYTWRTTGYEWCGIELETGNAECSCERVGCEMYVPAEHPVAIIFLIVWSFCSGILSFRPNFSRRL